MNEVVLESSLEVDKLIEEHGLCDRLIEHLDGLDHSVIGKILLDIVLEINLGLSEVAHEPVLVNYAFVNLLQSELQFPLNLLGQAVVALSLPVLVLAFEPRDLYLIISEETLAALEIVHRFLELFFVAIYLLQNLGHALFEVAHRFFEDQVLGLSRLIDELGHELTLVP